MEKTKFLPIESVGSPHNSVDLGCITLASGIDVGQGINIGPGEFGKKNKRRALNTHDLCCK